MSWIDNWVSLSSQKIVGISKPRQRCEECAQYRVSVEHREFDGGGYAHLCKKCYQKEASE